MNKVFMVYDDDCPRKKLGYVKAGNFDGAMEKISVKFKGLGRIQIVWPHVTGDMGSVSAIV